MKTSATEQQLVPPISVPPASNPDRCCLLSQTPSTLADICLNLVFNQLIRVLNEIENLKQETYIGKEKLLFRLLDFFQKPQPERGSTEIIRSLPSHLVRRLVRKYIEHVSLDVFDYGPNQLPLLLYISICSTYSDINVFGFRTLKPGPYCYHRLGIENLVEIKLVQNYLQPSECITILDLTGHSKFTDSSLVDLHNLLGHSVRSIILDYTSVTDQGISHLTRSISPDDSDQKPASDDTFKKQEAFTNLRMISMRGLGRITDRSAKKLILFPNLVSIDLTGTSCTDAIQIIFSKLTPRKEHLFHRARSKEEVDLFMNVLEPWERLDKVLNLHDKKTCSSRFLFCIHGSSYKSQRIKSNPASSISTKSNSLSSFWLVKRPPSSGPPSSAPDSMMTSKLTFISHPCTNSTATNLNDAQETSSMRIKQKKLNHCILNDLLEVKKM